MLLVDRIAEHIGQVEYDKPSELLKKKDGYFRGLVDGSGDKHALYKMAGSTVWDRVASVLS